MASKNTERKQEAEVLKDKAFLEEYKALVEPLQEKHGRRMIPIVSETSTPYRVSYEAVFGIDRFKKEVINVEKSKKSETIGQSDTDDKTS